MKKTEAVCDCISLVESSMKWTCSGNKAWSRPTLSFVILNKIELFLRIL